MGAKRETQRGGVTYRFQGWRVARPGSTPALCGADTHSLLCKWKPASRSAHKEVSSLSSMCRVSAEDLCLAAGPITPGFCPVSGLSFVTMARKICPLAKSLRWGWDLSHIFLSCSANTKTNSLLGGRSVRKINAVSLIPSPRSLSETAAARLKRFED